MAFQTDQSPNALPRLLSEAEAAAYLCISDVTLRRIRARGEIAHIRIARKAKYTEQQLLDYLAVQSVPSKEAARDTGGRRSRPRTDHSATEALKLAQQILLDASNGREQS